MPELSAYDGVALEYGNHTVFLRPSLRAATRLERLHDGFPALLQKIEEFDTRTVHTAIACCTEKHDADELINVLGTAPLSGFLKAAQAPLFELVNAMLPVAPEEDQGEPIGKPVPWAEVYRELYGLATGWLGWTPETAWHATPQEITDAFGAHIDMLKAIHGGADDHEESGAQNSYTLDQLQAIEEQDHDPAFDRAALHALKGKGKH